ncbi:MAG: two-component regulator propeller domain-containing protein [Pirellulales bacterium]
MTQIGRYISLSSVVNWFSTLLIVVLPLSSTTSTTDAAVPVSDTPFVQEFHERYELGISDSANDVRAVVVDSEGSIWVATRAGIYRLNQGQNHWIAMEESGPAFDITVDDSGTVWAGGWNGLYQSLGGRLKRFEEIDSPIASVCSVGTKIVCLGPRGHWVVQNGKAVAEDIASTRSIRAAIPDGKNGLWLATQMGLYRHTTEVEFNGYWKRDQLLSFDVRDVAYAQDGSLWVGGLGGVTVFKDSKLVEKFDGKTLASIDVRCVQQGPNGQMWVGTSLGVMRFDGNAWSLRQSKRWLVSNDVRDIAFDKEGTAWIATKAGISDIKNKPINLAEKAKHYDRICQARHVRAPGLVEKCFLKTAGDVTTWEPYDDDNDGQYTSLYLAMESFRYAVTKNPKAKKKTPSGHSRLCDYCKR